MKEVESTVWGFFCAAYLLIGVFALWVDVYYTDMWPTKASFTVCIIVSTVSFVRWASIKYGSDDSE